MILLSLPILGAVLGALVAFISVKILFWPARPRALPLVGWRVQGIVPGHREAIARALGTLVEERILSRPDLYARLVDPVLRGVAVGALAEAVGSRVRALIPAIVPAVAAAAVAGLVRRVAERELGFLISGYLDRLAEMVEGGLGLGRLVEERVMALTPEEIEELAMAIAGPQFRWLQAFGAIFGLIVGAAQAVILWSLLGR